MDGIFPNKDKFFKKRVKNKKSYKKWKKKLTIKNKI